MRTKVSNPALVWSIIITISWGLLLWLVIALTTGKVFWGLIVGILYFLIHPLIGAAFARIVLGLCAGIDKVFDLKNNKWSEWSGSAEIIFASFWPITGVPTVAFLAIGVSLGWFHKILFQR